MKKTKENNENPYLHHQIEHEDDVYDCNMTRPFELSTTSKPCSEHDIQTQTA